MSHCYKECHTLLSQWWRYSRHCWEEEQALWSSETGECQCFWQGCTGATLYWCCHKYPLCLLSLRLSLATGRWCSLSTLHWLVRDILPPASSVNSSWPQFPVCEASWLDWFGSRIRRYQLFHPHSHTLPKSRRTRVLLARFGRLRWQLVQLAPFPRSLLSVSLLFAPSVSLSLSHSSLGFVWDFFLPALPNCTQLHPFRASLFSWKEVLTHPRHLQCRSCMESESEECENAREVWKRSEVLWVLLLLCGASPAFAHIDDPLCLWITGTVAEKPCFLREWELDGVPVRLDTCTEKRAEGRATVSRFNSLT